MDELCQTIETSAAAIGNSDKGAQEELRLETARNILREMSSPLANEELSSNELIKMIHNLNLTVAQLTEWASELNAPKYDQVLADGFTLKHHIVELCMQFMRSFQVHASRLSNKLR